MKKRGGAMKDTEKGGNIKKKGKRERKRKEKLRKNMGKKERKHATETSTGITKMSGKLGPECLI